MKPKKIKMERREEKAKIELALGQILEMRFGDGSGNDLQVKLAQKEIMALLRQSNLALLERIRKWTKGRPLNTYEKDLLRGYLNNLRREVEK